MTDAQSNRGRTGEVRAKVAQSPGIGSHFLRIAIIGFMGAALAFASPARAQVIQGRISSSDSNSVRGAIVELVDSTGARIAQSLADGQGRFALRAPDDGLYRLRVLRIGYQPFLGATFRVGEDSTIRLALVAPSVPAVLPTMRVVGRAVCSDGAEKGPAALALWTEASNALRTTQLSPEHRRLRVRLALFEEDRDTISERVLDEQVQIVQGSARAPFYAIPAAELSRKGYAEADSAGVIFRAPDAAVLLSPEFAAGHCWHVAASRDTAHIGLAFAPVRTVPGIVDVAGTLWLDRATERLESLDFRYTNVDPTFAAAGGGGALTFTRLASGAWIVSRWSLRLPILAAVKSPEGRLVGDPMTGLSFRSGTQLVRRVARVHLTGGAVLEVAEDDGASWTAPIATVSGTVVESSSGRPLVGARITLAGTDYRATTDTTGRFHIGDVLPGRYEVALTDPVRDTMGIAPARARDVVVPDTGDVRLHFTLPSPAEALGRVCDVSGSTRLQPAVLLRGVALDAEDKLMGAGRTVVVSWYGDVKVTGEPGGVSITQEHRVVRTDSLGEFRVCPVPGGKLLLFDVSTANRGLTRVDSVVAPTNRPYLYVVLRTGRGAAPNATAAALLIGRLVDSAGRPLTGVEVRVRTTRLAAITDSLGAFWLSDIPTGRRVLEFRRVGLVPAFTNVDATAGETMHVTYRWDPAAVQLTPVVVSVQRRVLSNALAGFEARRKLGRGQFVTDAEFTQYAARSVADVLRRMHSVGVKVLNGATVAVSERGLKLLNGRPVDCVMPIAVNGIPMPTPFSLDDVPIADIAAVEVYAGPADIPAEFNGALHDAYCGLVMIWTRE